ncbi:AMP-binding protein [Streptomonospora litoralis]|uniref:Long-chain-fatty-acid--CoA ligase FadD19 n=1 Tax=Streptomonospora litoralis TaxID=2498135 RepID=A0A4P6PYJ8_9ACTN|nr:AMP-binding protein [Streptomonospora litoralis]QBI53203.1 Long-chain-fatty-acid--CoA ligase FadD19 [Streptomonospora litoralis]
MTETAERTPRARRSAAAPGGRGRADIRPGAGERRLTLAGLLRAVAAAVPERTALVGGGRRRTYAELDARADRLAGHLLAAGTAPGARVALLSRNRVEWLEAFFGVLRAGAVPVNLNQRYIRSELEYVLADSGCAALVAERAHAARLLDEGGGADLPALGHVVLVDDGTAAAAWETRAAGSAPRAADYTAAAAGAGGAAAPLPASGGEAHYLLYTGGTTGLPKGVVWRQADLFRAALERRGRGRPRAASPEEVARRARERRPRRMLVLGPLMHAAGQWNALSALFAGGTVVLSADREFDAERVLALAEAERVHTIQVVGDTMARPLARRLAGTPERCPDLAALTSGGTPLTPQVQQMWRNWRPRIAVNDSYGGSETGVCGAADAPESRAARFAMGGSVAVLDEHLRPLPPGSRCIGRIARTGRIPLGYHNDPELTARTFPVDPDGRRWVLSGDYGTVAQDGTVTLLGRGSAVVNTGGEKVFAEEVEAVVKSHPGVADAIVVGAPDEALGRRVAAIVAPAACGAPGAEELREYCREHLAGFKIPRALHVVEHVRRTAVGKQDYRWAAEVVRTPAAPSAEPDGTMRHPPSA